MAGYIICDVFPLCTSLKLDLNHQKSVVFAECGISRGNVTFKRDDSTSLRVRRHVSPSFTQDHPKALRRSQFIHHPNLQVLSETTPSPSPSPTSPASSTIQVTNDRRKDLNWMNRSHLSPITEILTYTLSSDNHKSIYWYPSTPRRKLSGVFIQLNPARTSNSIVDQ
ncbi:hypothetical protein OG21DRAFT_670051 [Imleria badia]|nr:hypothetical protein OG21DRAFT_670051 [Imleria badia]